MSDSTILLAGMIVTAIFGAGVFTFFRVKFESKAKNNRDFELIESGRRENYGS